MLSILLTAVQNTYAQCKQHAEFLNVEPGDTYSNR